MDEIARTLPVSFSAASLQAADEEKPERRAGETPVKDIERVVDLQTCCIMLYCYVLFFLKEPPSGQNIKVVVQIRKIGY